MVRSPQHLFNVWSDAGEHELTDADRQMMSQVAASGNVVISDAAPGHYAVSVENIDEAGMQAQIEAHQIVLKPFKAAYDKRMRENQAKNN